MKLAASASAITTSIAKIGVSNAQSFFRSPHVSYSCCCWWRKGRIMTMAQSPNFSSSSFSTSASNSDSPAIPSSNPQQQQHPWLIVGLGNPGKKYEGTRHNVGFGMVDAIAEAEGISMSAVNFKALFGKGFKGKLGILGGQHRVHSYN